MHSDPVRVAAVEALLLGGVGEFGMNMMAVRCGGTGLLVDAGVMFPGPERFGVDLVIPDIAELRGGATPINAAVLTHGHEDHIGAVPYVWDVIHGPIYGSALTLAMLDAKLRAHGVDPDGRLVTVAPGQTVTVGALRVEFIRVAHSMPDCLAVAIQTPLGVLVHTGDFKFDLTPPDREPVDVHRLAEIGSAGVLALFADSTNAERPGHTGSELDVVPALEKIFASATRLLIVATFASSLHRIQLLVDLATRFQRRVAFVGRASRTHPTSPGGSDVCACRMVRGYAKPISRTPTPRLCSASSPGRRVSPCRRSRESLPMRIATSHSAPATWWCSRRVRSRATSERLAGSKTTSRAVEPA